MPPPAVLQETNMSHPYVLATILLFAADAAAQRLNVYDPAGPGFIELTAPTTLLPAVAGKNRFYRVICP